MAGVMKVTGRKITCMARASISGQTAGFTRVSLLTITGMARAYSSGQINGDMRGCGTWVRCMGKAT
jgi:hypothetical protein